MNPAPPAARLSLADARDVASRVLGRLQREPTALRLGVTGEIRRMEPTVGWVGLMATAHDPDALLAAFADPAFCEEVVVRTPGQVFARMKGDALVSLRVYPAEDPSFVTALFEHTGDVEHVEAVRRHAASRGLRLTSDGLFRDEERVELSTEEEIYAHVGLPYRPPELRHDANLSAVPDDLVTMFDVKGLATIRVPEGSAFSLYDVVLRAAQEGYVWVVADTTPEKAVEIQAQLLEDERPIRVFPLCEIGEPLQIREGEDPARDWHESAQASGSKVLTTAAIERPSDIDKAIPALGAARRGAWRVCAVLNTLEPDVFAAWCEANR